MSPLSPRQQTILNRVVDTHIQTATPVASGQITSLFRSLYRDFYSSATVRHEMGVLEGQGYLTHPHTSAGRVPTDRGYRFYVDHGVSYEPASADTGTSFAVHMPDTAEEFEAFTEQVSDAVSGLSEEACVIVVPYRMQKGGIGYKLILQGSARMVRKPEFQDPEKIERLLSVFEKKKELAGWLSERTPRNGLKVSIGRENEPAALHDCTVVSAQFYANGSLTGTLALIGPRRMHYARALPLVHQISIWLGNVFAERQSSGFYES